MNIQEAIKSDPDFHALFHYGAQCKHTDTNILVFSLAKRHDVDPRLVTDLYIASLRAIKDVVVVEWPNRGI